MNRVYISCSVPATTCSLIWFIFRAASYLQSDVDQMLQGGETIKGMQNSTGARVHIDQQAWTCTITGTPQAVEQAAQVPLAQPSLGPFVHPYFFCMVNSVALTLKRFHLQMITTITNGGDAPNFAPPGGPPSNVVGH